MRILNNPDTILAGGTAMYVVQLRAAETLSEEIIVPDSWTTAGFLEGCLLAFLCLAGKRTRSLPAIRGRGWQN